MGRGRPRKVDNMNENSSLIEATTDRQEITDTQNLSNNKTITIKHEKLRNVTISCLDGVEVAFDDEGITEVEEKRIADYLLSIPSYKQI